MQPGRTFELKVERFGGSGSAQSGCIEDGKEMGVGEEMEEGEGGEARGPPASWYPLCTAVLHSSFPTYLSPWN